MSSQFNYDLDERQIKLILLDVELDGNEAAWQRFESFSKSEVNRPLAGISLPKIDVSVSRSFIIPIIFVSLIGGLSTLLFSFVDFKKSEIVKVEKPLIPNAKNVLPIAKINTVAKVQVKNTIVVPKPVTNINPIVTNETKSSETRSTIADVKIHTTPVAENKPTVNPVEVKTNTTIAAKTTSVTVLKHKKKKRITYEELPIISSQTIETSTPEPEINIDPK